MPARYIRHAILEGANKVPNLLGFDCPRNVGVRGYELAMMSDDSHSGTVSKH